MRITNVNFDTWCKNHSSDHDAKWCRILYPWEIFSLIDYGKHNLGLKQLIRSNRLKYTALISRFYIGKNARPNFLIGLKLNAKSKNARWKNILWNTRFHLVASKSGHFITLFTEKRDPAKALLGAFMNCNFSRIEAQRCITYSNLLFRTLVTYRAEELFGDQFNPSPFDWVRGGVRNLTPHRQFRPQPRSMLPLWANKRALWVTASSPWQNPDFSGLCSFRTLALRWPNDGFQERKTANRAGSTPRNAPKGDSRLSSAPLGPK